jgi:hypothetical protein
VEKVLADVLADFYQTMLKPEFDAIKGTLAEHDERFSEILGHFPSIDQRLGRLEEECFQADSKLSRIEDLLT